MAKAEKAKGKALGQVDESELARAFVVEMRLPNGEPFRFNLHDVTWIDLDDLHGEVQGQAQRYAFYAMLAVGVKDELRAATRELAAYVAAAGEAVRAELGPKATETHVRQTISLREPHVRLQARIDELEDLKDRVAVVREALTQRRDMLQSACMIRGPERSPDAAERAARSYRLRS